MFNTKKNRIKELENRLITALLYNELLEKQVENYQGRLDAEIKESEKWKKRCHELYKEAQEK